MKKILLSIWKVIRNKYVAATLVFLLFFLFLGENNVLVTHQLKRDVASLNREIDLLEHDIKQDSAEAESLFGNMDALETYGREHYYMKRDNEDIYIIKD
jgi:cell division protein FtsB